MGKKRKSIASRLDEVDRTIYSSFSSAANSLSQLYSQAMNQQKISFQAGERHGLEKVYQWILRKNEEGCILTPADIAAYLQNEIDYIGEDVPTSPRMQIQSHHSQPTTHSANPGMHPSLLSGQSMGGHGLRSGYSDQTKNLVFSDALSSSVRSNLQLAQGGRNYLTLPTGNGRTLETTSANQNRDTPLSSNDSLMDMHSDSPAHDSY